MFGDEIPIEELEGNTKRNGLDLVDSYLRLYPVTDCAGRTA